MSIPLADTPSFPADDIGERIAGLFPFAVSVCALRGTVLAPEGQTPAERRTAHRRQFVSGRVCAQRALAGLDVFAAVGRQSSGAPDWPEGVTGSISHAPGLCAAVVARTSVACALGLDIERLDAAPGELSTLICAPDEAAPIGVFGGCNWLTALFSAKEAFYKCHFVMQRRFLDFTDWRSTFHQRGERSGTFTIEPAGGDHAAFPGHGFWFFNDTHVCTGFSVPSPRLERNALPPP